MPPIMRRVLQILAVSFLVPMQAQAFAEQSTQILSSKEPVVVNGDKVEYFHEQKKAQKFGYL